jgi:pyruvate/2-oxoglutarate dehydrogenase complex dihydrolipoamide acyltransferase (E2) component
MERPAHFLVVPDIGAAGGAIVLSLWLVPEGAAVMEGDRVAELAWGGATVDLEAPVTGRLVRQLVDEDARVVAGMTIAEFVPPEAMHERRR